MYRSTHFFIHDSSKHDEFLVEYLNRIIQDENLIDYFYIRYWQGGPHIRFRWKAKNEENFYLKIETIFQEFKNGYKPSIFLEKDSFYKNHPLDNEFFPEDRLYWFRDGTLKEIEYERELTRYGGEKRIHLSEKMFNATSILAMDNLVNTTNSHTLQMKIFLSIHFYLFALRFIKEQQGDFLDRYKNFWEKFSENESQLNIDKIADTYITNFDVFEKLFHSRVPSAIQQFIENIRELEDDDKDLVPYIIFSQIHMFNNRIGLPVNYESKLPSIVKKILMEN